MAATPALQEALILFKFERDRRDNTGAGMVARIVESAFSQQEQRIAALEQRLRALEARLKTE